MSHKGYYSEWLDNFLNSDFAQKRIVQADYFSRLKQMVEEQKNKGTYVNVESALEDFSRRLNLSNVQKRILASLVREAGLSEDSDPLHQDKLEKEMKEQGAPKSILPGVKPNKKTNNQPINKDLGDDVTGEDVDAGMAEFSMRGSSNKRSLFGEKKSDSLYEFVLDYGKLYLNLTVEKQGSNRATWYLTVKKGQPEKVESGSIQNVISLATTIDKLIQENVQDEGVKESARTEIKELIAWTKAPYVPSIDEEEPLHIKQVEKIKKEKKEKEYGLLADNLEDVEVPEEAAEKKTKSLLPGIQLPETKPEKKKPFKMEGISLSFDLGGSKSDLLGITTPKEGDFVKNYSKAQKTYESLQEKFDRLERVRKTALSAYKLVQAAIRYTQHGRSIDDAIESFQQQIDEESSKEDPNYNLIQSLEIKLETAQQVKIKLPKILQQHSISPSDPELSSKLENLALELQQTRTRINKQKNKLDEKLSFSEQQMLYYSHEKERNELAKFLSDNIKTIKGPNKEHFDKWVEQVTQKGSKQQETLQQDLSTVFDVNDPNQAKMLNRLKAFMDEDFASKPQEAKAVYKALTSHSGFLAIRPEMLQDIYGKQLESENPVIKRRKNQIRADGEEYVVSIVDPNKTYRGYLPSEELVRAASLLLFNMSEDQMIEKNRDKAIDFINEQRAKAIQQLTASGNRSLLSNLSSLYSRAYQIKDPRAQEQYEKVMEEARKYVDPDLRGYLIHPTRPLEEILNDDLIKEAVNRVVLPSGETPSSDTYPAYGHYGSLNDPTNPDFYSLLERVAIIKGYALESYDVTLADHVNGVYIDQCSRFISTLTRKSNSYAGIINKHSLEATQICTSTMKKEGIEEDTIKAVLPYLKLYENLFEKAIEQSLLEEQKGESFKGKLKGLQLSESPGGFGKRAEIAEAVREKIREEKPEQAEEIILAFNKAFAAREKKDTSIARNIRRRAHMQNLGKGAALVYSGLAKGTDFKVVTPETVAKIELTPSVFRQQIYDEANFAGRQIDNYQANALLRRLFVSFYENAFGGEDEFIQDLTQIFPVNKAEAEKTRQSYKQTLLEASEVAARLGSRGVVTGSSHPIFIFSETPPESGEVEGTRYTLRGTHLMDVDKQVVGAAKLSIGSDSYYCWIGDEVQVKSQIEQYRKKKKHLVARFTDKKKPEEVADFLSGYAADVEATSKLSKHIFNKTGKTLSFTLEGLKLSIDDAKRIWNEEVASLIKDENNPLGLRPLPGPPRSRWGKKPTANFVLDGNAWKIGRKSTIYRNTTKWLEGLTERSDEEDKRVRQRVNTIRSQLRQLDFMLGRVANYNSETVGSLPKAEVLLGKKSFNPSLLKKVDYLLDVAQGKIITPALDAEQAVDRLLRFIHRVSGDLRQERADIENNGKSHATIWLTCPNIHLNRDFSAFVTYVKGRTNLAPLNSASPEEIREVFEWAESAVKDPDLEEEKNSIAGRFQQDRYVIVGEKPTCPVCGFKFYNIDSEISRSIREDRGDYVAGEASPYLRDLEREKAKDSFDQIKLALTWLESPNNAEKTREEFPYTYNDIEKWGVSQAEVNWGTQKTEEMIEKAKQAEEEGVIPPKVQDFSQGIRLPLIKEILESEDIEDLEVPYTKSCPVPYQKVWQVELYNILLIWKKNLISTFRFKDELSLAALRSKSMWDKLSEQPIPAWKERLVEEEESGPIVKKEPIFIRTEAGLTVGHENNIPIVYKENEESQLDFYADVDEKDPERVIPHGSERYVANVKVMDKRAEAAITLFELASDLKIDQLKNYVTQNSLENLVRLLFPSDVMDAPILAKDSETFKMLIENLLSSGEPEKYTNQLSEFLLDSFGVLLSRSPEDWGSLTDGNYSTILEHRLSRFDVPAQAAKIASGIIGRLNKGLAGLTDEGFRASIETKAEKFAQLSRSVAEIKQKEVLQAWEWLTNKIVRFKNSALKEAKIFEFRNSTKKETEEDTEEVSKDEFEEIREMFKYNEFPSLTQVRKDLGLPIETTGELKRVDRMLQVVNRMLDVIESTKSGSSEERSVGQKERLVNRFVDSLFEIAEVSEDKFRQMEAAAKQIKELIIWSDYAYDIDSPNEIAEDISLIYGKDVFKGTSAKSLLESFSQALSEINNRHKELRQIRSRITSKFMAMITTEQRQPGDSGVDAKPHPDFFYRIGKVKATGVRKTSSYANPIKVRIGEEEFSKSTRELGALLEQVEPAVIEGKQSKQAYKDLLEKYLIRLLKKIRFTAGSVTLELVPLVKHGDLYYTAFTDSVATDSPTQKVPETASVALEYTLPARLVKSVPLYLFSTKSELREVYEEIFSKLFDFASVLNTSS